MHMLHAFAHSKFSIARNSACHADSLALVDQVLTTALSLDGLASLHCPTTFVASRRSLKGGGGKHSCALGEADPSDEKYRSELIDRR
jgi:hypothetical protein